MHPESAAEFRLPRSPEAGRLARTFVEDLVRPHLSDNATGNLKMVVAELVNNAVLHGEGEIVLRAEIRANAVHVEVVDEGSGATPSIRKDPQPDALGGWGLRTVDALASRWGTFEGSTHVWADVPLR